MGILFSSQEENSLVAYELRKTDSARGVDEQNRSKPFHWQSENIANAALDLDHAWRARTNFQFALQP